LVNLETNGAVSSTAADLIDTVLGSGVKSGYTFSFTAGGSNASYTITATPVTAGVTGQRGFFTDQSGVIRGDTSGSATSASTPIS
jgi:type IV pilus assembly protein PilA